jgi:hypothetical protein
MAKTKKIVVRKSGSTYKSKTDPNSKPVQGHDDIVWTIVGVPLPSSAEVQLRFADGRVIGSNQLTDSKNREISAKVQNKGLLDGERFPYTVWFADGATVYCMEDPELVMDGDTPIIGGPKKKNANRQKAAVQRPIKKKAAKKR